MGPVIVSRRSSPISIPALSSLCWSDHAQDPGYNCNERMSASQSIRVGGSNSGHSSDPVQAPEKRGGGALTIPAARILSAPVTMPTASIIMLRRRRDGWRIPPLSALQEDGTVVLQDIRARSTVAEHNRRGDGVGRICIQWRRGRKRRRRRKLREHTQMVDERGCGQCMHPEHINDDEVRDARPTGSGWANTMSREVGTVRLTRAPPPPPPPSLLLRSRPRLSSLETPRTQQNAVRSTRSTGAGTALFLNVGNTGTCAKVVPCLCSLLVCKTKKLLAKYCSRLQPNPNKNVVRTQLYRWKSHPDQGITATACTLENKCRMCTVVPRSHCPGTDR